MKRTFWLKKGVKILLMVTAFVFLFSWIVMLLWNNVIVAVTGASVVTLWQAMGILVLSKILFGGFRKGWGGGGPQGNHWKEKMKARWENMTDTEKAEFQDRWKNKCNAWRRNRFTREANDTAAE